MSARLALLGVLSLALTACGRTESPIAGPIAVREDSVTTSDGIRLNYRVAGSAADTTIIAPFALFHGTSLDSLAGSFQVVTYDPRGRGRSGPVDPSQVSLDQLLLDLETVRAAIGAERFVLLGWSGGGMEGFVYALRHPTRVIRMIQLAPVAARFDPYGGAMMDDRVRRTDSTLDAAVQRRIAAGVYADSAAACRAIDSVTAPPTFAAPATRPATPDVCVFPNEYPGRLGPYFQALFRSIDGYDWRDSLARVTIPRLVIHGARDNTPRAGNEEWVRGQANARFLEIEGAGHWPHYEQPNLTLAAIATFIRGDWPAGAVALP
jgi:pimeloyl-ACP methyl ester carboxylesterase